MMPTEPPVHLHFLVPGFSKCGTTTLCSLLAEHPQLFMPTGHNKEPRFFGDPDFEQHWSDYMEFFAEAPPGAFLGEGSPNYAGVTDGEGARRRILQLYPHIKLIFIARDPIDRIESSFREFHHSGTLYGIPAPFHLHQALATFPELIEDARFLTRIDSFRHQMPADQIMVVFLEDLKSSPDEVLSECFKFLGVDPTVRITNAQRQLNPGSQKLYDTKQLRDMRNYVLSPETSVSLHKLDLDIQDQFLKPFGLRRQFTQGPLEWNQDSVHRVAEALGEEIPVFLDTFGKPGDFWPRFTQMMSQVTSGK